MKKYIIAIDEGTTGVRCIVFDRNMNIITKSYEKLNLIYPEKDYVEQSGEEIYEKTVLTLRKAVLEGGIDPKQIECIGISTQRSTWMPWCRSTGRPIMNMITWMDKRGIPVFEELKQDMEFKERFPQIYRALQPQQIMCGLTQLIRTHPDVKRMMDEDDIQFGTVDTWIIHRLTKGKVFASNASNASTTRMLNHKSCEWNYELLDYLGFSRSMFAEVKNEADDYGLLDREILGVEIPITAAAADQQSALFGQNCMSPFTVKTTNGTGSFVTFNLGSEYQPGEGAYTSLVAWKLPDQVCYMAEGFLPTAGAAFEWLKNEMGMVKTFEEINEICERTPNTNGVFFSPSLSGFRAPLNDPSARAAFLGISGSCKVEHCVRSVVEAIAYANAHIIEDICDKFGIESLKSIKLSGGVSQNNLLGQMISNIMDTEVEKPVVLEASAMGAAELAGIYTGYYTIEDVGSFVEIEKVYKPDHLGVEHINNYELWKKAILRTMDWQF